MRSIAVLVYFHLFCCVVLLMIIGGLNYFRDDRVIPFAQVFIVVGLYLLYSISISSLIVTCGRSWKRIILNSLIYVFLSCTFIPFIDFLIHDVLPHVGVVFFDITLPENTAAFRARLVSGYLTANGLALVASLLHFANKLLVDKRRLNGNLKQFRDRAAAMKYISHFLTTLFMSRFGEMLVNKVPKDMTTKRDIIQFLAYLLEVEQPAKSNTLGEEMDHLGCFVRLLKFYYGEGAIQFAQQCSGDLNREIPVGVLFFPLENCLKHARISVDHPVLYRLEYTDVQLSLSCRNHWLPKAEEIQSGTGFMLLKAKLGQVNYQSSVDIAREGNIFVVNLKLEFLKRNEQIKL